MRILVTDGMDKTAMAELKAQGHEVVEQFYEPAELGKALRDFDVVVVRSKTKVRAAQIEEAKGSQLKLIIRGGVGVDNIDVDYAMAAGIDDVGLGVLFGLEGYAYEFAGLLMHAEHLEAVFGVGPHTISVPRVKPASDIDPDAFDNGIPDEMFEKIIALIRIAVPYTGMIISTRESQAVRAAALQLGVSQISGGSRTSVGGYGEETRPHDTEQFDVSDTRTLDEVIGWLMGEGHLPSFCTACYRAGRTGDRFMEFCKSGQIQDFCQPNALLTLGEYLCDYASPAVAEKGWKMIDTELARVPDDRRRALAADYLARVRTGERDCRF